MPTPVYQKEALARLASPDQLDHLMPLTSPRGWIALGTIAAALILGLIWTFTGSMAVRIEGQGILLRPGGIRQIVAPVAGTVDRINVGPGDLVQPSQELLRLRSASGAAKPLEIVTPLEARVLDVAVQPQDSVEEGTPLVRLESLDQPLEAVLYLPAADAYRVHSGMEVVVRPSSAGNGLPEFVRGRVRSAARFPATREALSRMLGSEELVGHLTRSGPCVKIDVELLTESAEVLHALYSGTPCRARITIGRFRPVNLIVPARD